MRTCGSGRKGFGASCTCKVGLGSASYTHCRIQVFMCNRMSDTYRCGSLTNTPKFTCVGIHNGARAMPAGQKPLVFAHAYHAFLSEWPYVKGYIRYVYEHKTARSPRVNQSPSTLCRRSVPTSMMDLRVHVWVPMSARHICT